MLTKHALDSPEVRKAGDVGEEGARSRFGQPNRDGSEEEPEPGKEQGVYKRRAARAQDRGSPGRCNRQKRQGTV